MQKLLRIYSNTLVRAVLTSEALALKAHVAQLMNVFQIVFFSVITGQIKVLSATLVVPGGKNHTRKEASAGTHGLTGVWHRRSQAGFTAGTRQVVDMQVLS